VKSLSAAAMADMNFSRCGEILAHVLEYSILNNILFIQVSIYLKMVCLKISTYACTKILWSSVLHAYKRRRISEKNL
jgi:hypothetical protein